MSLGIVSTNKMEDVLGFRQFSRDKDSTWFFPYVTWFAPATRKADSEKIRPIFL